METTEQKHFDRLKKLVVNKMQQLHPEIPEMMSDWKGQDILTFQVELRENQKEYISEKWFYTHMKTGSEKLPRIDTLNLLSKFAGYKSWDDFKYNHRRTVENQATYSDKSNRLFIIVPGLVLAVTLLFYLTISTIYNQEYSFCFVDRNTDEAINHGMIYINVLVEGESPIYYICDEFGCFSIKYNNRSLSFVVDAPGYHSDTIVRRLNRFNRDEIIWLRPDRSIDQ